MYSHTVEAGAPLSGISDSTPPLFSTSSLSSFSSVFLLALLLFHSCIDLTVWLYLTCFRLDIFGLIMWCTCLSSHLRVILCAVLLGLSHVAAIVLDVEDPGLY